jgi:hypothetical protein
MADSIDYSRIYTLLGSLTPLRSDCGRLCGSACCAVSPDLPGMYLFPGEARCYEGKEGFVIHPTEMPGYGPVQLLSCDGHCDRSTRPLACRVFPLAPKVLASAVKTRLDPRGRPVCPLCHQSRAALSSEFVAGVEAVFAELMQHPDTEAFLRALSMHIDRYDLPLL